MAEHRPIFTWRVAAQAQLRRPRVPVRGRSQGPLSGIEAVARTMQAVTRTASRGSMNRTSWRHVLLLVAASRETPGGAGNPAGRDEFHARLLFLVDSIAAIGTKHSV